MLNRLLDDAKRADLALPSAPDQQFLYYHFKSDLQPYLMIRLEVVIDNSQPTSATLTTPRIRPAHLSKAAGAGH
jgi:hypothetical protein